VLCIFVSLALPVNVWLATKVLCNHPDAVWLAGSVCTVMQVSGGRIEELIPLLAVFPHHVDADKTVILQLGVGFILRPAPITFGRQNEDKNHVLIINHDEMGDLILLTLARRYHRVFSRTHQSFRSSSKGSTPRWSCTHHAVTKNAGQMCTPSQVRVFIDVGDPCRCCSNMKLTLPSNSASNALPPGCLSPVEYPNDCGCHLVHVQTAAAPPVSWCSCLLSVLFVIIRGG
jgi:hypothetical protein